MHSYVKGLTALVVGVGVASARLPVAAIHHGLFHELAEAATNEQQNQVQGVMMDPIPANSPAVDVFPHEEVKIFMADDDDDHEPTYPPKKPEEPIYAGIAESCRADYMKLCGPDAIPYSWHEQPYGIHRFYTSTSQVIFNAARRLTGGSEYAEEDSTQERPMRTFGRSFYEHVSRYRHRPPAEGMAHRETTETSTSYPEATHFTRDAADGSHFHNGPHHAESHFRVNGKHYDHHQFHGHHEDEHHHHTLAHVHRHDHHHEHHSHRRHLTTTEETSESVELKNPFGDNFQVEMCMRGNIPNLSDECRQEIEYYDSMTGEGDSDSVEYRHAMTHLWISALFWLTLSTCVCKKARARKQKYQQIRSVMEALHANPDLKAAVESAAGVEVPQIRRIRSCCFFVGAAIIGTWAGLVLLGAIAVTCGYFTQENPEAGEKTAWVLIGVVGVLLAAMLFALVRRMRRAGHFSRPQRLWEYSYNGTNNGYIALTGAESPSAPAAENPQHIYTGIPVPPPSSSAAANQHVYNPVNVL